MSRPGWCGAIIVAAGGSSRMAGIDKQFAPLLGRPVLAWSVAAFEQSPGVDAVVVVANPRTVERVRALGTAEGWSKVVAVVAGGSRRQDSAALGLAALERAATGCRASLELVMVHDGARPLADPNLIARGIAAGREHKAVVASVRVRDTLKIVGAGGRIECTPERESLWQAQTPQVFRYDLLSRAYQAAREQELAVTDDAMLLEWLGEPVFVYEGDPANLKITSPEDLLIAAALLAARPASSTRF